MSAVKTVSETNVVGLQLINRGKVRDVYRVDDARLLMIATDRISAFDCVLPNPIPRKGEVLTSLSVFWFGQLQNLSKHHLITADVDEMADLVNNAGDFRGRAMLVRKTDVFPVECVVRGYLEGSGWRDYLETGAICGHRLPEGLQQCDRLPEPIFTPATKAAAGHDENITEDEFTEIVGTENAKRLKSLTLDIYKQASGRFTHN